jgi:RNA polymerase sigma factor (sigma-70 family)
MERLSDPDLLGRFVARQDEEAFAALVRRHGPMVLRLCQRSLRSQQDAEDVFQATFLVLCRKAKSLQGCESLASWLYGVAVRLAMKGQVQEARRRARERRAAVPAPPDPLAEISVREAQAILDQELVRLPEKYRAPLVLCCLEGLTRDEAAQQLGWSVGLVKSRLEQARELLGKRLPRRGLAPGSALLAFLVAGQTARAAVPAPLCEATVQAAVHGAAAGAAAGVSSTAVLLAEGFLRATLAARIAIATLVLAVAGFASLGLGMAGSGGENSPPAQQVPRSAVTNSPAEPEAQIASRQIGVPKLPTIQDERTPRAADPIKPALAAKADTPTRKLRASNGEGERSRRDRGTGTSRRRHPEDHPESAVSPRSERRRAAQTRSDDDDWDDWYERGSREKERSKRKDRTGRDD